MDVRALPLAKPCPARWDEMEGSSTERFCRECRQSVHDLTAMREDEAHAFVRAHPTACLRYTFDKRTGAILHNAARCGTARVRIRARQTGVLAALGLVLAAPAAAAPMVEGSWPSWLQEALVWLGVVEPEPEPEHPESPESPESPDTMTVMGR
jgi:hypothetical protein